MTLFICPFGEDCHKTNGISVKQFNDAIKDPELYWWFFNLPLEQKEKIVKIFNDGFLTIYNNDKPC